MPDTPRNDLPIRRWTPDDPVDRITALLHTAFAVGPNQPYPYPARIQAPEITLKQIQEGTCWLAWAGERLAGAAILYRPAPYGNLESGAYLAQLAVHPDFQGCGIGSRLLETCERDAVNMGACGVWASSPVNSRQLSLFLRHGYRFLEYKAWPDTSYDSIVFGRRLRGKDRVVSRIRMRLRYYGSLVLRKFGILEYGGLRALPKRLIAFGLWWINRLCRSVSVSRRKDILLYCDEPYMVDYLAPFWELFRHDSRLRFRLVVTFPSEEAGEAYRHVAQRLPVRQISQRGTRIRPWDLLECPNHCHPGFVPQSPSVYIGHGPKCKVENDATELAYGALSLDRSGHPLYSLMFAETEEEKIKAVAERPELEEVVQVVGNLESDAVLAELPRRDEFRKQFGFQAEETVVFVLSTWGEHCLWHKMGDALLEEIRKWKSEFRFVLSAHPLEYRNWHTMGDAFDEDIQKWKRESRFVAREHPLEYHSKPGRIWGEYLRSQRQHGLIVREPSESWIPYMVASDIVVSDYTGLIEYAILLERRIVLTPVPESMIWKESTVAKVREFAPILDDARLLRDRLKESQADYPMEQLRQLARRAYPYPGEAAERIRQAIYRVLDLAPLEPAR